MITQSNLFEFVLGKCGCNSSFERVTSANTFVAQVIDLIIKNSEPILQTEQEEVQEVRNVLEAININLFFLKGKLEFYVKAHKEGLLERLAFSKATARFTVENLASPNAVLTVDWMLKALFADPTPALQECIKKKKEGSEGSEEDTPSTHTKKPDPFEVEWPGSPTARKKKPSETPFSGSDDDDDEFSFLKADTGEDVPDEEEIPQLPPKEQMVKIVRQTRDIYTFLSDTVIGQEQAVTSFVAGYFQSELSALTQKNRTKPRATFLFAGSPGVGKTFLSEQAAKVLGLPYCRFDMSEYADKEANLEFCGSDKVYKNGKEGNVTSFVAQNPHSIILFDEVEKAHPNVIYLFLQILDAGRIRDNYTDEEVPFADTILIFTTNAGRRMYEDESINLATATRKTILKALGGDINPNTGAPLFPAAICSRFASGNVIMFNRLEADQLLHIAGKEINAQIEGISRSMELSITQDARLPYAILFAEGGKADARAIKGRSGSFVYQELHELFRLIDSESNSYDLSKLENIKFLLELPDDEKIRSLFRKEEAHGVLLFAEEEVCARCEELAKSTTLYTAHTIKDAEELLARKEISLILCDLTCGAKEKDVDVLNIEDIVSEGSTFFHTAVERYPQPVYILTDREKLGREEISSLVSAGAKEVVHLNDELNDTLRRAAEHVFQRENLLSLARANKVLTHKTKQSMNEDGTEASITLYDFKLTTALDAEDTDGVLDNVSRPSVRFDDVIGAKDAKDELTYFISYLRDPARFARQGIKPPKGILLYGPPGTGKTLLAKAMAGESDVTFIHAEGNQFLRSLVGEGTQAVHDLFRTARKYAPSILFIDEIDAIGKQRGMSNSAEYTSDVLTAFLTEMDGFNVDPTRPVFVLAATNFGIEKNTAQSLDPALMRRFDRRIYVELPNKEERIAYLNLKLKKTEKHSITKEMIENLAVRSTGMSLADLESIFELAKRNVIKSNGYTLTDEIFEEAFEIFNSGDVKKWDSSELLCTARHEAGHALLCRLGGEKPSYLTVVARGNHGGYMQHGDTEKKGSYNKREMIALVRTALGGRAAEMVYYGEDGISTGASSDLRQATRLVQSMICDYGMDEQIGLGVLPLQDGIGAGYGDMIVKRINEILLEELDTARALVEKHRCIMDELVTALMERNSLKSEEIEAILGKAVEADKI